MEKFNSPFPSLPSFPRNKLKILIENGQTVKVNTVF
jgi:hypothetical protein